jgi:hypothetical protein
MWKQVAFLGISASLFSGCLSSDTTGETSLLVTTPVYRANKIFYVLEPKKDEYNKIRYSDLVEPYEWVASPLERSSPVHNGEPVTIVVNRAYIPPDRIAPQRTRDIAVLLDIGMRTGQNEQFIAVWYQRGVPADEPLSFQDLVVYSEDSWDNRVPPYFRIRLVDVTTERNAATAEMLDQVAEFSGVLSSLTSSPLSGSIMSVGLRAARLVLANKKNRALIDYTFHLFSIAQRDEAGGMPLGLFRTGGFVIMGQPLGADSAFWASEFQYDHSLRRIQRQTDGKPVGTPYLMATVMTAEAVIPTVVKRRSERIAEVLTDQKTVRTELSEVIRDAMSLQAALNALNMREKFCRFPSKESFKAFLDAVQSNWDKMPDPERNWLLSSLRIITQVDRATIEDYDEWYQACGKNTEFDPEARKFKVGGSADVNAKNCK